MEKTNVIRLQLFMFSFLSLYGLLLALLGLLLTEKVDLETYLWKKGILTNYDSFPAMKIRDGFIYHGINQE